MTNKPLTCSVKPPVKVKVGDASVDFHSGCSVMDVSFTSVFYVEVQEIHLKNYYTASVSVLAKQRESAKEGGDPKWRVCVRQFPLMPHPHCEQGSEDYFILNHKHFAFPLQNVTGLRFVLRQPSPVWKEYRLEDVTLYKAPQQVAEDMRLPRWLSDAIKKDQDLDSEKHLKGVASVDDLSRDLQSLWALTEEARVNQSDASLGRYDVDGSYEINLLSYT